MEQGQGIGLVVVVVLHVEASLSRDLDHFVLTGVALASPEGFDRPDWHPLVRDAPLLTEGSQAGQEAAVDVGRVGSLVAPDLLEGQPADGFERVHLLKPTLEAEEAHTASLEATGFEVLGAEVDMAGDPLREVTGRPADVGAQVEGYESHRRSPRSWSLVWLQYQGGCPSRT